MKTILVSYDLRAPGRDYEPLWDHLKSYPDWAKPLESFWLVKTQSSAEQVFDAAARFIDSNDRLIAIDVTDDAAKWRVHNATISQWIKDNL